MDTMTVTELQSQLHAAIRDLVEIEKAMGADDYREGLEESHIQAFYRVEELAKRIPSPARSLTDIILRAEVAWAFADKTDGVLDALDDDAAAVDRAAAQAIAAVRELAAIRY